MNKKILNQIVILTLCNVLTYSLFFFYRVFISRRIGSVGMGLYTFGMTLYYLFYSISSGGILTAISKYIAENCYTVGLKEKVVFVLSKILFLWSIMIAILFWILNPFFCDFVFTTPQLKHLVYPLIACVVVVTQSAILKGFFYGIQNPTPPALAEVFENIVRLSITCPIFLTVSTSSSLDTKLLLSFLGILIGEISSLSFLWISYKFKYKNPQILINLSDIAEISSNVFKVSIPLATASVVGMIFQSFENMIIPKTFEIIGNTKSQAISIYGIINGMSFPAATLPLVIINSLSIIIVPTISETKINTKALNSRINSFLLLTIAISLPVTCIFLLFPTQICNLLYKNSQAGVYLKHIAPAIVFYYLSVVLSSLLNALDKANFNFILNTVLTAARLIAYIPTILLFKSEISYIWISNIFALISCIIMIEKISNLEFEFIIEKRIIFLIFQFAVVCLLIFTILIFLNITSMQVFIILFLSGYSLLSYFIFLYQKRRKEK
ncbi:oligosaccharide flippase family protein [Anaerocellum diazotrophicum]|uniref:oligosaccharide flippase family protein n=1 Tax=Caldicellulosiruptor diazotrophicus TaxID=2806205 RepID=UPI001A92FA7A|nr:oligosaccharide flippase family protein [Caldicellulosiruptor diazotrophicus]